MQTPPAFSPRCRRCCQTPGWKGSGAVNKKAFALNARWSPKLLTTPGLHGDALILQIESQHRAHCGWSPPAGFLFHHRSAGEAVPHCPAPRTGTSSSWQAGRMAPLCSVVSGSTTSGGLMPVQVRAVAVKVLSSSWRFATRARAGRIRRRVAQIRFQEAQGAGRIHQAKAGSAIWNF